MWNCSQIFRTPLIPRLPRNVTAYPPTYNFGDTLNLPPMVAVAEPAGAKLTMSEATSTPATARHSGPSFLSKVLLLLGSR